MQDSVKGPVFVEFLKDALRIPIIPPAAANIASISKADFCHFSLLFLPALNILSMEISDSSEDTQSVPPIGGEPRGTTNNYFTTISKLTRNIRNLENEKRQLQSQDDTTAIEAITTSSDRTKRIAQLESILQDLVLIEQAQKRGKLARAKEKIGQVETKRSKYVENYGTMHDVSDANVIKEST